MPRSKWSGPARVVIHAGFRKTGSTTIQDFLARNASAMPSWLSVSPRDDLTRPWRKAVAAHIEAPKPRVLRKEAAALRKSVQAYAGQTLLISDENLFGQSLVTEDGRDIFELAATFLRLIEEALEGAQVEFVFYTREESSWLRSAWAQAVKRSGVSEDFASWVETLPKLEFDSGLKHVCGTLNSPCHVFRMEDDLKDGAAMFGQALYRHVGLEDAFLAGLEKPDARNQSLPETALGFLQKLNALGLPSRDRRRVARLVEDNPELFSKQALS